MLEDDKKLNLPAIRKGGLMKPSKPKMRPLDLSKSAAVSAIQENKKTIKEEIARKEQGLDLVLVGDLTTSMTDYHELLKRKFSELCSDLSPIIKNLRIGIVFYLDHDRGLPYLTRRNDLTKNVEELQRFIQDTPVLRSGNDTFDEAMEDAFHDIINLSWREIGNRSVVLFGDARPHEPEKCPNQHSYFDLLQKMYNSDIVVNTVFCGGGGYSQETLQKLEDVDVGDFSKRVSHLDHPNFFSWVANITGGMILNVEQIDDLIEIIKAAAAKDSGNLDKYEDALKLKAPSKLKLAKIAKKAQQRRIAAKKQFLLGNKP